MSRGSWGSRLARGALGCRDLRCLWVGETISKLGSTVSAVVVPLIAVVTLHAGAFVVGLLSAAAWLPWLVIGLPAGAWVDRMACRRVMLGADAVSLVLFLSVPLVAWLGLLSIGQLLAVALLGGASGVFFQTAYQAYLPTVVDRPRLAGANALVQGSESAAQVAGPGLAGAMVTLFGAVSGMLVDAASFVVSALCLLLIRTPEPALASPEPEPRPRLRHEIAEGASFVTRDPYLRVMTIWGAMSNLGLIGYQSLLVLFLVRDVRVSPGLVGVLIGLTSLGGVIGAAAAPAIGRRLGTAHGFLLCEVAAAPAALLIALTGPGARLALLIVGGIVVGAGVVAGNVLKAGWRQTYCPPPLLARVIASSQLLNYGTIPVGALLAGGLATSLGIHATIWIMTGVLALSPAVLLAAPLREARDLPSAPRTLGVG